MKLATCTRLMRSTGFDVPGQDMLCVLGLLLCWA